MAWRKEIRMTGDEGTALQTQCYRHECYNEEIEYFIDTLYQGYQPICNKCLIGMGYELNR